MILPVVVPIAAGLFLLFRHFEKQGRGTVVIAIIWGILLVELALYPNQSTVPPGLFHPVFGGLSFRLFDVLIPVAVMARISVHGLAKFGGNALLWAAFLMWILTAGVIGVLNGHPFDQIAFEAKAVAYLSAIYLTATIPAREYLESRHIYRLIGVSAVLATVLLVTDTIGVAINLGARPPEGADLSVAGTDALDPAGALSADAATIFAALGILALALGFNTVDNRQRTGLMIAAAPLLASTIGGGQRAAFLELVVALMLLVLLVVISRRALQTTPTEIALAGMIGVVLVLGPTLVSTADTGKVQHPPFEREIVASVSGRVEEQTTEGRINQWRIARHLIAQRPVFGHGLGTQYEYWDPGFFHFFKVDVTHNIVLDLLLRSGLVGLLLFIAAIGTSAYRGLRAWLRMNDDLVAALALGTLAAIGGLLAKGLAESVFEKYRVAVGLALLIGILISVASAYEREPSRS